MWFLVNSTPGSPTEERVECWIKQTVRMAPACHPPFWFQSALVTWGTDPILYQQILKDT
jgi:hypothetical protein